MKYLNIWENLNQSKPLIPLKVELKSMCIYIFKKYIFLTADTQIVKLELSKKEYVSTEFLCDRNSMAYILLTRSHI